MDGPHHHRCVVFEIHVSLHDNNFCVSGRNKHTVEAWIGICLAKNRALPVIHIVLRYVRFTDKPDDHTASFVEQYVGNVTKDTEITFEFGVKSEKKDKKKKKQEKTEAGKETVVSVVMILYLGYRVSPSLAFLCYMMCCILYLCCCCFHWWIVIGFMYFIWVIQSNTLGLPLIVWSAPEEPKEASSKPEDKPEEAEQLAEGDEPKAEDDGAAKEDTSEAQAEASAADETVAAASASAESATAHDPLPPPLMIDGKENLPFQLFITYTSREGAESMRVISRAKPVTKNRDEAENGMSIFSSSALFLLLLPVHRFMVLLTGLFGVVWFACCVCVLMEELLNSESMKCSAYAQQPVKWGLAFAQCRKNFKRTW